MFYYDTGVKRIEPEPEKVSYGAFSRCCTCLESIVLLIRNGYVGSANALLRQVYDLLVWAKMALNTDNDAVLVEIHDDFFKDKADKDRVYSHADKTFHEYHRGGVNLPQ